MTLHTLIKPKSKFEIQFVVDPHPDNDDGWFILVKHIVKKTGKTDRESLIIRKDVNTWISHFNSDGWTEVIK